MRAALVTGVGRRIGIGYAIVRRLREDGLAVFAHAWEPEDAIVAELGAAIAVEDFSDPTAPARVVDTARASLGALDVLVVNHAVSEPGAIDATSAEQLDRHLHVNLRGSLLLVQAFARQLDPDRGGRVVLLTSGQHDGPMPGEIAYVASKGALQQVTASLAAELAPRGVTVNAVDPGPTDTGWGIGDHDPAPHMPSGRWGEPDDAARLVAWLCSDDARWVTGQTIRSDGGFRP